jgi:hypothetical protein
MTDTPLSVAQRIEKKLNRIVLSYEDLERLRRQEEESQQGKAPWRIPPVADRDGPLVRTTNLTTGKN